LAVVAVFFHLQHPSRFYPTPTKSLLSFMEIVKYNVEELIKALKTAQKMSMTIFMISGLKTRQSVARYKSCKIYLSKQNLF
jgi:hypothetical protein